VQRPDQVTVPVRGCSNRSPGFSHLQPPSRVPLWSTVLADVRTKNPFAAALNNHQVDLVFSLRDQGHWPAIGCLNRAGVSVKRLRVV
jgi:hypothetical protein